MKNVKLSFHLSVQQHLQLKAFEDYFYCSQYQLYLCYDQDPDEATVKRGPQTQAEPTPGEIYGILFFFFQCNKNQIFPLKDSNS